MEFLNVGGGELLIIVLLALVLFGPEDIAKLMRRIGRYARAARGYWDQFRTSVQHEIPTDLADDVKEVQQVAADAATVLKETKSELSSTSSEASNAIKDVTKTAQAELTDISRALDDRKTRQTAKAVIPAAGAGAAWPSPVTTQVNTTDSPVIDKPSEGTTEETPDQSESNAENADIIPSSNSDIPNMEV